MSGHNKWSKIKHKKAATDSVRSRLFSRHARMIAMESRLALGDITRPNLAAAIERAKKDSLPKENIERAVARGNSLDGSTLETVLFETYGPGGVAILITAITDNNNRTNQLIKHALSLEGYQLGSPGSATWAFSKATTEYTPNTPITLTREDHAALDLLVESLEEIDDVQAIFTSAAPQL